MEDYEKPLNPKASIPKIYKTSPTTEEAKEKKALLNVTVERTKHVMSFMDSLLTLLIVSPLIVGYWRGTWTLLDIYSKAFPAWESFLFGASLHLSFTIMRDGLQDLIKFKTNSWTKTLLAYSLRRLYTYLFAVACILNWRGGWIIFDEWLGIEFLPDGRVQEGRNLPIVVGVLVVALVLLGVLRSFRNILAVPFVIALDTKSTAFDFPTRYRRTMEEKTSLYVLDCLFSVFIIGTLVVFVWRGAWVLIDVYLFPENEIWSAWGSLVLGYAAVALAFLMQPAMRWLCDRLQGAARLLIADIFLFFSFVGTVNVWRGIWNLLNLYFIPDNLELSAWITHWGCLVLLILLKCSNTLLVRGVYIDAEEPAGKCVVFPIYYLRLIFQHERAKKITKKFQLEAMARRKLELDSVKSTCTCGAEIKNHIGNNKEISQHTEQNHQPEV